ncbi:MAG: DUF559 domain-containing protein [bacterium]|nr:DUF559 domain-containing protein [bacterium]
MHYHDLGKMKEFRRELRNNPTPQEKLLWKYIRSEYLGVKFRRQHSIGEFIVDFYCPSQKLIIEIDGATHKQAQEYDKERTHFLESLGFKIIRFWNSEIDTNLDKVLSKIRTSLSR